MKPFILKFVKTYLLFIFIFIAEKLIFMLWYDNLYKDLGFADYFKVIAHGLKLDASVAGYLTIIPALLLILSLWMDRRFLHLCQKIYFAIVAVLLSAIFIGDLLLYEYWGFRLDSTPLFYLKSPASAFASVDWITVVLGFATVFLVSFGLYFLFKKLLIQEHKKEKLPYNVSPIAGVLFLLTAFLFIPIRGGFTVSTMNTGQVYFSPVLEVNHAAINPCFSLLESLNREQNFSSQYRFMPDEQAKEIFQTLTDRMPLSSDTIPELFTIERPNIIFVVLESFMSKVVEPLGGVKGVAPRLNQLCDEGILFTNFYANSFRTDRGLVSIFSGYPAQPTTSIMKYPQKTQSLPSVPRSLKNQGYDLQYYYGGDADFTNMRSYLVSCGINSIISDKDFPLKQRLSKWGALDEVLFNRMSDDLEQQPQTEPFMKILQTSSSHEPFDVPISKLQNPYLNSVFYTDSCLGVFIDRYKQTKYWDNTVIVLVPDHAMRYPDNLDNRNIERYQIPLLLVGGAIKESLQIDYYASQIDLAATLLHQLNIPHNEFTFSKNILNPSNPHFGYFTFPDLFGMVTEDNQFVYDCETNKIIVDEGNIQTQNLLKGQAFLQVLYDDLAAR